MGPAGRSPRTLWRRRRRPSEGTGGRGGVGGVWCPALHRAKDDASYGYDYDINVVDRCLTAASLSHGVLPSDQSHVVFMGDANMMGI